jgi:hypothetical protein
MSGKPTGTKVKHPAVKTKPNLPKTNDGKDVRLKDGRWEVYSVATGDVLRNPQSDST